MPGGCLRDHERLDKCSMLLDQVTDTLCYGDSISPVEVSAMLLTVAKELRTLTDGEFEELQTYTEIRDKLMLLSSVSTV